MKAKVGILGHFGEGKSLLNGQTVKTKIITAELQRQFGRDQVLKIDTHGGWKILLKSPIHVLRVLTDSENVLIFPAHNGLRVYAPLLSFFNVFFKRGLHYVVIGGWLPEFAAKRKWLARILKKFDGIYVETQTMKSALECQGFENIYVMPNCKRLSVLSENELAYFDVAPYRLCTFSRVMKEKGIETAIDVVKKVNNELGYTAYTLDVYGQVDTGQVEWFDDIRSEFPEYIRYCGCVDAQKSVEVLKDYFALLFPTHFYTEGIPGTIIDAYAAGVPVISAKWESFSDVVDDGITGIGYEFDRVDMLCDIMKNVACTPSIINRMRCNCLTRADRYLPENAIKVLKI